MIKSLLTDFPPKTIKLFDSMNHVMMSDSSFRENLGHVH